MVIVVAARSVFLRPELLNEDVWAPTLESTCALLDTANGWGARDGSFVGETDSRVEALDAGIPNCRRGEVRLATLSLV